jgi:parallel beta-helix repeat protein
MFVLVGLSLFACVNGDAEEEVSTEPPPSSSPSVPAASPPADAPSSSQEPPKCPVGKTCIALEPSDAEARVAEVFATAKPGTVILLGAGTFSLTNTLALAGEDVIVRGAGRDVTVFDFAGQKAGGEGLLAEHANGLVLESFSVVDTRGNGIKALDATDVTMRDIGVRWTSEDAASHGAYGLYPVRSKRVLVEDGLASGASDAGIYVGQSDGATVRRNVTSGNVAGIEVENSFHVDVHDNEAAANAQGILVVDLPWVPLTGGRAIRVHHNVIAGNDGENFSAKGSFVGSLPGGLGLMVMASEDVEIFANTIEDNASANLLVASFALTGNRVDEEFDPHPSRIFVHGNTFGGGGGAPDETRPIGGVLAAGIATYPGGVVPSIVYDGIDGARSGGEQNPQELCIRANPNATFANLHRDEPGRGASFDLAPHDCALPAIALETVTP